MPLREGAGPPRRGGGGGAGRAAARPPRVHPRARSAAAAAPRRAAPRRRGCPACSRALGAGGEGAPRLLVTETAGPRGQVGGLVEAGAEGGPGDAARAARRLLEWGRVGEHAACFAATFVGKRLVRDLEVAGTLRRARQLQAETAAALFLVQRLGVDLDFGGLDSRRAERALQRTRKGGCLGPAELLAVRRLVEAAERNANAVQAAKGVLPEAPERLAPLAAMTDTVGRFPGVAEAITRAVDDAGAVRDGASKDLGALRGKIATATARLRAALKRKTGTLSEYKGRICLAVPEAGAAASLGGVTLGREGGCLQVEPLAAVAGNNELAELRRQEAALEEQVCWRLTGEVGDVLEELDHAFRVLMALDAVGARARYTAYLDGTLPELTDPAALVERQVALHAGGPGAGAGEEGGGEAPLEASVALKNLQHPILLWNHKQDAAKHGGVAQETRPVVPIDVAVSPQTRAVVITGPNTGGKTATLKAVGLAALMAKAGLGVPAAAPARLPCFDEVFADIGDEQSLSSNLSTFSGHLRRIQGLLLEASDASLVLLDEVGTGTDPVEGSALGLALLKGLVGFGRPSALLTLATTHHSPLAALKYEDGRFENASVEFDAEALAPTYRLLWGVPGRSNALAIAGRLGLAPEIVARARGKLGGEWQDVETAVEQLERVNAELADQAQEAERLRAEAAGVRRQLADERAAAAEYARRLRGRNAARVKRHALNARHQLKAVRKSGAHRKKAEKAGKRKADAAAPAASAPVASADKKAKAAAAAARQKALGPKVGQTVMVMEYKVRARVVSVAGNSVTVDLGMLGRKTVPLSGVRQ